MVADPAVQKDREKVHSEIGGPAYEEDIINFAYDPLYRRGDICPGHDGHGCKIFGIRKISLLLIYFICLHLAVHCFSAKHKKSLTKHYHFARISQ